MSLGDFDEMERAKKRHSEMTLHLSINYRQMRCLSELSNTKK